MGIYQFNSIIVTGYSDDIEKAHTIARGFFENNVTEITSMEANNIKFFFIALNGEKYENTRSEEQKRKRKQFLFSMKNTFGLGSSLYWIEVTYGENFDIPEITHHKYSSIIL